MLGGRAPCLRTPLPHRHIPARHLCCGSAAAALLRPATEVAQRARESAPVGTGGASESGVACHGHDGGEAVQEGRGRMWHEAEAWWQEEKALQQ